MIIHHDPRDGVALAAFKSEWWPASRRNSGRLQIGTPGRLRRNTQVSKSDKLIEDAQRDWAALGQERLQIAPLARFRPGAPVTLSEGVLFTTYATLRSEERHGKASRLQQIVAWLGRGFDGVIVFDEAHAMANAAGDTGERGDKAKPTPGHKIYPYLLRGMTIDRPNQVWAMDITYVPSRRA